MITVMKKALMVNIVNKNTMISKLYNWLNCNSRTKYPNSKGFQNRGKSNHIFDID